MKKILLSILALAICSAIYGQSKRTALFEEFTGSNCPPCATSTPFIDESMALNADNVVQLRYQVPIPTGPELMYNDNTGEVDARRTYYGNNQAPDPYLDGQSVGGTFPDLLPQSAIDQAISRDAPVLITVSHTLSADEMSLDIAVQVINEGSDAYSMNTDMLRVALTEQVITWDSPPGTTPMTHFEGVMKKFFTDPNGTEVPEIAAGETWEMTWDGMDISGINIYDITQLEVVAFVQDDFTKRVVNAGTSVPIVLGDYVNLAIENTSTVDGGLCDYAFTPKILVTNPGKATVDQYDVVFYVNNFEIERRTIDTPIPPGGFNNIVLTELDLPGGNNVIYYEVEADGDIGELSNVTTTIAAGKIGGATTSVENSFESETAGDVTTVMIVDAPINFLVVNQDVWGGNAPLGGSGMSQNSLLIPFYFWANAGEMGSATILDQVEVTSATPAITWDYAYTSFQSSNDGMAAQISTDCGENFTTLWEKSGSDLATAPEVNNPNNVWFRPDADQWESAQIDLSNYIGEEVIVRFQFTSQYGDNLYVDNINTDALSSLDELDQDESIAVYPNPAVNELTVDMNVNQVSDVNIRMVNVLGETVLTERMNSVSGSNRSTIDVSGLVPGAYVIYMTVGDKEVVRRVSVAK